MSFLPDAQLTTRALQMAYELYAHLRQIMFHSDYELAIIPVVNIDRHYSVIR